MTESETKLILMECFEKLAMRGYVVSVVFEGSDITCMQLSGGDPSCPCKHPFNPKTGHGWTFVHVDDVPDDVLDELDDGRSSLEYSLGLFNWMEKHVLSLEGKEQE